MKDSKNWLTLMKASFYRECDCENHGGNGVEHFSCNTSNTCNTNWKSNLNENFDGIKEIKVCVLNNEMA